MKFWIVGTDTDVGKTTISSWICLHTKYEYWKPVQTGSLSQTDSQIVKTVAGVFVHKEAYSLRKPLSPHIAAQKESIVIDTTKIIVPSSKNLLMEAAGGLLVPLNDDEFYIDYIKKTGFPVILVARNALGTINHTCLSIEAIRNRKIKVLGVIVNGEKNDDNIMSIEKYGKVNVLAVFERLSNVDAISLKAIELPQKLRSVINA